METTKVIFRVLKGGDVIALFPELLGDVGKPYTCNSYLLVGQHGSAYYTGIVSESRLATPEEYARIKRELEGNPFNYQLEVVKRETPKMRRKREGQARRA